MKTLPTEHSKLRCPRKASPFSDVGRFAHFDRLALLAWPRLHQKAAVGTILDLKLGGLASRIPREN